MTSGQTKSEAKFRKKGNSFLFEFHEIKPLFEYSALCNDRGKSIHILLIHFVPEQQKKKQGQRILEN